MWIFNFKCLCLIVCLSTFCPAHENSTCLGLNIYSEIIKVWFLLIKVWKFDWLYGLGEFLGQVEFLILLIGRLGEQTNEGLRSNQMVRQPSGSTAFRQGLFKQHPKSALIWKTATPVVILFFLSSYECFDSQLAKLRQLSYNFSLNFF